MGGGFLWGAFAHAFLCLMVVFNQQPQPGSSIPLTMGAVGVLVSYTGTALLPTQIAVNSGTTPKNGPQNLRYRCPTCDGPLKKNGYHQRRKTW